MNDIRQWWASDRTIFFLLLLISIPILLVNLGVVPFIEDEGIRALVALEMLHNDQYITPTLYGEYYYKKPPLWNWILIGSYVITGSVNEFTTRLPTVFFVYIFTISIYLIYRKYVGERVAMLSALFFLTCGRILFWDSMLGLIDICFGWTIFLQFWWIYRTQSEQKYLPLYVGVYLLTAVAFMLKALPALVFAGFSLLTSHIYFGSFKKLFSWQHVVGIIILLGSLSIYFFAFSQHQSLDTLFTTFLRESTQRTAAEHTLSDTVYHVFSFPFEMIYHFLPWSMLAPIFFQKKIKQLFSNNPFVAYTVIIFLANIWVYWSSPEVYPRYLFMFGPLYFGAGLYLYFNSKNDLLKKVVDICLAVLAFAVLIGSASVFIIPATKHIPALLWRWLLVALPMALFLFLMLRFNKWKMLGFCAFLLFARLGFSLIVLPVRGSTTLGAEIRHDAQRIGHMYHPLHIYQNDTLRFETGFYLTTSGGQPIPVVSTPNDTSHLLVNKPNINTLRGSYRVLDSLRIHRPEKYLYLLQFTK